MLETEILVSLIIVFKFNDFNFPVEMIDLILLESASWRAPSVGKLIEVVNKDSVWLLEPRKSIKSELNVLSSWF